MVMCIFAKLVKISIRYLYHHFNSSVSVMYKNSVDFKNGCIFRIISFV